MSDLESFYRGLYNDRESDYKQAVQEMREQENLLRRTNGKSGILTIEARTDSAERNAEGDIKDAYETALGKIENAEKKAKIAADAQAAQLEAEADSEAAKMELEQRKFDKKLGLEEQRFTLKVEKGMYDRAKALYEEGVIDWKTFKELLGEGGLL